MDVLGAEMSVKLEFTDSEGFSYEVESDDGKDTGLYMRGMLQVVEPLADWPVKVDEPTAFLPHSCGKWVIGGVREMRLLVADLSKLIEQIEDTEEPK